MTRMFGHAVRRVAVAAACFALVLVGPPVKPAAACTCFGDAIQTAEAVGMPDVVFTGRVVDRSPSDVTEGFVVGEPGIAYVFEVDTVRAGAVGATVVVHAPGGNGAGNCSIPEPTGPQFVAARFDDLGFLRGGLCSIYPVDQAPRPADLTTAFGPEQAPDPSIEVEGLVAVDDFAEAEDAPDPEPTQIFDDVESPIDGGSSPILVVSLVAAIGLAMLGGKYWMQRGP